MKYLIRLTFLIFIALTGVHFANADTQKQEVGITEKLGNQIPENLSFWDEDGKKVILSDIVDKPTIIAFVYFHCPGICSPLQSGLAEVIDHIQMEPGKDFRVLSISFDHNEQPDKAKKWQKEYLGSMKRKFDKENWKFLTGDSLSVRALTDAAGFYFKPDGKDDFIHSATLIVLTPSGKISRYLLGTEFNPFDLKMAVLEADKEKWSPSISKLIEFCYSYDPDGKKYVLNINKIAGAVIFLSIGIFFTFLVIKGKKNQNNIEDK